MRAICPNCEKETELELIHKKMHQNPKGTIKVSVKYSKCTAYGEKFEAYRSDDAPLDKAYRKYRRRHCMRQPEEIKNFRKRYELTQNELNNLLGRGRYENGDIEVDEKEYPGGVMGEVYSSNKEPGFSLFSDGELNIFSSVKIHFQNFSAKKITKFSHEEKGYKKTPLGGLISYDYAESLQI